MIMSAMGSEEEGMMYQDEEGNIVMHPYAGDMMGDDDDQEHLDDSYGMEGSPEVSNGHPLFE